MSTSVIARVSEEIAGDIDFFAQQEQVDRSTEIRRLLAAATQERRIEYALAKYKNKEITLWKAAKLARVPLTEMMTKAAQLQIPIDYREEDLWADFHSVFGR